MKISFEALSCPVKKLLLPKAKKILGNTACVMDLEVRGILRNSKTWL
jgi:hypothetical protein